MEKYSRLRIVVLRLLRLAKSDEMYLSEIAERIGISRALAKIHLKKLERVGIVTSRLILDEERGKALRYYKLVPFKIEISPEVILEVSNNAIPMIAYLMNKGSVRVSVIGTHTYTGKTVELEGVVMSLNRDNYSLKLLVEGGREVGDRNSKGVDVKASSIIVYGVKE